MKYVDEFRDPELIKRALAEIRELAKTDRHFRVMEVCGGHTHAIFRFGLKDLLPSNVELIHGPGCPVCVLPMGRIDDGLDLAGDPNVIFTAFGDMMRVPGSKGSPLESKARGADVRIVYSPLDALKIAQANPLRKVVFFAIGFETTAPSTALTIKLAKAQSVTNFAVFCNHVTIIPAIRALLESPDMRLDAFIGPGHVSTVIGCRPYHFIARDYRCPIAVSGFEPLDILQSLVMVLRQLRQGEAKVENQYQRVVPWEGNLAALKVLAEVFDIRPHFEWRGLGFVAQSALRIRDEYAIWDAEKTMSIPGICVADPKAAQCGEVLKGVLKPHQCKLFGKECTPERPIGALMVSSEGACAAHYKYAQYELPVLSELRDWPMLKHNSVVFHDKQIAMAHGAGGEASRRLVEGLFAPAFANSVLENMADAALLEPVAGRLAMTTDSFVVRPLRFPGGSIGELAVNGTVNDLAVSGATPIALSVGFILEAGLDCDTLRAEVQAMADAARNANVRIVAGDTKVVEHGKADGMYISTTGIGVVDSRADLGPKRVQTTDRVLLSGPIGAHGMTIMIARADLNLAADVRSDTRPLTALVRALLDEAGQGVKWMRDATRGGVATVLNELARDAELPIALCEEAIPVDDVVRGGCELLGLDPLHVANEGQFIAIVSADCADAALRALRATPGGHRACDIGEVTQGRLARVVAKASYGGVRVVDMLIGDPLPRIC